ncbi:putative S-layer protein [Candidatus Woesearchaeota archaeon]|nr:putative S-layer protein [Candidatus Woesearchaeota archaeon]
MKKLAAVITMLVLASFIAYAFTQGTASLTWVKNSSTSVQENFTVTNTDSSGIASVTFTVSALTSGSNTLSGDIAISPNGTSLNAGQSKDITVSLSGVSASQALGTYTGIITSNHDGNQTNSTITVEVESTSIQVGVPSSLSFENAKRGQSFAKTFTINNTGNVALNNIVLGTTVPAQYSPLFNATSFSLAPSKTKDVSLNITIPDDESFGNKTLGSISINSNEQNFGNLISVSADVESNLNIVDVDATIGTEREGVEEDETLDTKAVPGDRVVFEVRVENLFPDSEDMEIRDIAVTGTIIEIDDGDDLEFEADEFDLESDRSDSVFLTFELPEDSEDGTFDVEIEATGEDEDGVTHSDTFDFSIEVERRRHEIKFTSVELDNSQVSCNEEAQLSYEVINVGREDEDNVKVTVSSSKISLEEEQAGIELESEPDGDNTYSGSFTVKGASEGAYQITARAYYDTILDDAETVTLTVKDCGKENVSVTVPVIVPKNITTTPTPQVPKQNATPAAENATATPIAVTRSIETSFFETGEYTLLLVLGSVVALLLIVILLAYLIPRNVNPY